MNIQGLNDREIQYELNIREVDLTKFDDTPDQILIKLLEEEALDSSLFPQGQINEDIIQLEIYTSNRLNEIEENFSRETINILKHLEDRINRVKGNTTEIEGINLDKQLRRIRKIRQNVNKSLVEIGNQDKNVSILQNLPPLPISLPRSPTLQLYSNPLITDQYRVESNFPVTSVTTMSSNSKKYTGTISKQYDLNRFSITNPIESNITSMSSQIKPISYPYPVNTFSTMATNHWNQPITSTGIISDSPSKFSSNTNNPSTRYPIKENVKFERRLKPVPLQEWKIKFSGKSNENVNEFLTKVNRMSRAQAISEVELLGSIFLLLEGNALKWYDAFVDDYKNWEEFSNGLRSEYSDIDNEESIRQAIIERKQTRNETFGEYRVAMEILFRQLRLPLSNSEKLRYLYKNLWPTYIRGLGFRSSNNINSIEELTQMCREIERVEKLCRENANSNLRRFQQINLIKDNTSEPHSQQFRNSNNLPNRFQKRDSNNNNNYRNSKQYEHRTQQAVHPTNNFDKPRYRNSKDYPFNNTKSQPNQNFRCVNCFDSSHRFEECNKPRRAKYLCYRCGREDTTYPHCPTCHPHLLIEKPLINHNVNSKNTDRPVENNARIQNTSNQSTHNYSLDNIPDKSNDITQQKLDLCTIFIQKPGDNRLYVNIDINGENITGLLDTGATVTVLGKDVYEFLKKCNLKTRNINSEILVANGQSLKVNEVVDIKITFNNQVQEITAHVLPQITQQLILGMDFWQLFDLHPSIFYIESTVNRENSRCNIELLTFEQKQKVSEVIETFPITSDTNFGRTSLITHNIDTGDNKPIVQKCYPISPYVLQAADVELKRMLDLGVIQPCPNSPWHSPMTIVYKSNGKEYEKLDHFPVPTREEQITKLLKIRKCVTQNLADAFINSSKRYNLRARAPTFNEGQSVWRRNFMLSDSSKNITSKFLPKWIKAIIVKKNLVQAPT